jgi:mono/diheme cytochrome c family protein
MEVPPIMTASRPALLTALFAAFVLPAAIASAQGGGDPQKGKAFVEERCARCHAVGREGDSPLPIAPPLRTLASKYPLEALEESLAEGIVTGHPAMPEFQLAPEQIVDLIAWLDEISR